MKIGDIVRVVEDGAEKVGLGIVHALRDSGTADIHQLVTNGVRSIENVIAHPTLAAAQEPGAGEHSTVTIAPLLDAQPAPAEEETTSPVGQ